ncbi:NAD(P)-dependent alcohol dehydrogenase [Pontibacter sp. BT310]|jgi:alcohol dehydrogenase (NADP+)|uniref:NAD(P)-dependent alcohol dehydrogenase n=1 Tax=Pontibacter populi TaxID=890055 RepID=A0ABS6XB36_9BACT|nr:MULTISPECIES: NAD(P)-dependent alcohol dehydrogenase [Pontibacter]MBJ6118364.1 NAD(P)-dependent alcohol dehydrogenase [Pontibacter sp. BT310]MBR0570791.1 NAD(P)-dependent alcohol dehydrogenase [Microvirga sp. STS03]MBW3365217.1 NAD(P)-dependent alcohol dehydrogenase [Pontibacter populi]
MNQAKAYAAFDAESPLAPWSLERREVGEHDVLIEIKYCGVCHSDLHQVRNEWGGAMYPLVPGHEIVGVVTKVGSKVKKFKTGDLAGVGCFVDSCRECHSCKEGLEQYCEVQNVGTYSSYERDGKTITYGGYSSHIVVDENYTLKVPKNLDLARTAPLLCAGITTYSPIMQWEIGKGHRVGIVGLGGLGHMAVKIAAAKGADVTVLSTSPNKEQDARDLGAHNFAVTKDPETLKQLRNSFDFIIDTVSAPHDYNLYLSMLKRDGTMILLGAPPEPSPVAGFSLIARRKRLAGSMIGGIAETQEMLDFCAEHNIMSDIELIPISEINNAYERMLRSDVKYRFVIDMASL